MFAFVIEKSLFAFEADRLHIEPLFALPPNNQSMIPFYLLNLSV